MNKQRIILPVGVVLAAMLSACSQTGGGQAAAPPPPPAVVNPQPLMTDTPTPAPGGEVGPGEIVYVASGHLLAMRPDGSNNRLIYIPADGAVLRDLAASPDGHFLTFTINGTDVMLLDLLKGQVNKLDTSATDRFSALVWTLDSQTLYYHQMVVGADSKPTHSKVMAIGTQSSEEPRQILDFDLATNMPIQPVAAWRGGLLFMHQVDLAGGSLGQWFIYDPIQQSLTPLYKDFGLWDVSPDRTKMLLFNTVDLAGGPGSPSVPIFSAELDMLQGAVSRVRLTLEEQQVHIEQGHYGPDGIHIAALQYVNVEGGVRRQVVLLSPASGDKYAITRLAPDDTVDDVSVIWGGAGLIVERLRAGKAELWQVLLDGSAVSLLAPGEQPVVIPPR